VNQKGFSLLEILLASVLLAILSLFLVKISEKSNAISTRSYARFDSQQMLSEIARALEKPEICESSFSGKAITEDIEIKGSDGNVRFSAGAEFGKMKIHSLEAENIDLPSDGGGGFYIKVKISRKNSTNLAEIPEKKIFVKAINNAGLVQKCSALGTSGISNFTCSGLFAEGSPDLGPPDSEVDWVLKGFDSLGVPICVKMKKPIALCKCCYGDGSDVRVYQGTPHHWDYFFRNCGYGRQDSPNNVNFDDSLAPRGSMCSKGLDAGIGSISGVHNRDCI
jgi:prepilin-type N-terminal cleavage/methylation domain-containing protein